MGGMICKETCKAFCEEFCDEKSEKQSSLPWFSNVEVDWNGCRKLARLPPPGQHPRLFFTKEEIPRILARLTHSEVGPQLQSILKDAQTMFLQDYSKMHVLSHEEVMNPFKREIIDEFFIAEDKKNVNMLAAYAYGVIHDDNDLIQKTKEMAVFFARVILRSKEIAIQQDLHCKPYNVWHSNEWDLQISWLFGGHCYALLYDIMFNDLQAEERDIMRLAITTAVKGRRGWGMGWPIRRIQSNWASYHGDLLLLSAVVEGEEGYDDEVFVLYSDLMVHYLDYAIYDSGHPIEDSYVLNVGLREGALVFLAMARRGHNVFNHPNFKKIWTKWLPYALEPQNDGKIYGGSSGNNWDYPTCVIVTKYMFPKDVLIDHIYRHVMCEDGKKYSRLKKIQTRIAALAFAIPALNPIRHEVVPNELSELPLEFVCLDRGKIITRSSWNENAMWYTFDARADGFLIGHDTCSRGAFVLSADGRNWGHCPEWKCFKDSTDYSIVNIDGVGQKDKAPFVKLFNVLTGGLCGSSFASADLTYAYNWTWTSWAKEGQDYSQLGYELEPNDPRDFGYNIWWIPQKLYNEKHVGFAGLHQWRMRFASVEKVLRSSLFVRAARPYVIVADNVKKDEEQHTYTWSMTTPTDVQLDSFDGKDAILKETAKSGRRFLLRSLCTNSEPISCSFREIAKLNTKIKKNELAHQVVFSCTATEVHFRFLLLSLPHLDSMPLETTWTENDTVLNVFDSATGSSQKLSFIDGSEGETIMKVVETC